MKPRWAEIFDLPAILQSPAALSWFAENRETLIGPHDPWDLRSPDTTQYDAWVAQAATDPVKAVRAAEDALFQRASREAGSGAPHTKHDEVTAGYVYDKTRPR